MGTFTMYGGNDAPKFAPDSGNTGTGTFTCKLKLKCTTKKVPLAVTADKFLLTVNPGESEVNYYDDTYVTVDRADPKFTVDDGERDFTITVKNVKLAAGDKVEFIYFPRIQASSGILHLEDDCQARHFRQRHRPRVICFVHSTPKAYALGVFVCPSPSFCQNASKDF